MSASARKSIRAQMLMAFTVLIALTVIIAGISIVKLYEINAAVARTDQLLSVENGAVATLDHAILEANTLADKLQGDPSKFTDETRAMLKDWVAKSSEAASAVSKIRHNQDLVKLVSGSTEAYATATEGFIKALDNDRDEFAQAIFISRLNKNYVRIRRSLSQLNTIEVKAATEAVKSLRTTGDLITIAACTAGSVILALIISLLFSRSITSILRSVLESVRQFGRGDFSAEVKVTSSTEFGEVQKGLEAMRRDLSGIIALVKDTSGKIVDAMGNVSSISDRIRASSKDSQSRALTVAAASDEMVSTTADIAKNCEAAARDAGTTNSITQQSIASVQQTIDIIKKQAEKTRSDADQIAALAEQADKVSTIVETIESIASQTNLLALNAAIEAARAGEAGKGFAVVADEVRTLASRTSRSTQEITKMVTGIQQGAKACNDSMAMSCENMNQIAASSDGIKETLGKVSSQVSGVSEEISQVTSAVEQQNLATSEISTNMQGITKAAKELSDDAAGCDESVDSAQALLRDLNDRLVQIRLGEGDQGFGAPSAPLN